MFKHSGHAWLICYAGGGVTPPVKVAGPPKGSTDLYYSTEAALFDGPNPSWAARTANQQLAAEAARHYGDVSIDQLAKIVDPDALAASIQEFKKAGYNPIFCAHRLNSLRTDDLDPSEPDPVGIVVVVPELPARDRNSAYSKRLSVRKHESFKNFLEAPGSVIAGLEQVTVGEGFCVRLAGRHNGETIAKNKANCLAREAEMDGEQSAGPSIETPGGVVPIVIG